jgi:hypothetical protein
MLSIYIGYDHPQGQGKVIYNNSCKAQWDIYIPQNMHRFPFLCIIARGNHMHHPPLPTRLPQDIASDIISAIRQCNILSLTARKHSIY